MRYVTYADVKAMQPGAEVFIQQLRYSDKGFVVDYYMPCKVVKVTDKKWLKVVPFEGEGKPIYLKPFWPIDTKPDRSITYGFAGTNDHVMLTESEDEYKATMARYQKRASEIREISAKAEAAIKEYEKNVQRQQEELRQRVVEANRDEIERQLEDGANPHDLLRWWRVVVNAQGAMRVVILCVLIVGKHQWHATGAAYINNGTIVPMNPEREMPTRGTYAEAVRDGLIETAIRLWTDAASE